MGCPGPGRPGLQRKDFNSTPVSNLFLLSLVFARLVLRLTILEQLGNCKQRSLEFPPINSCCAAAACSMQVEAAQRIKDI